MTHAPRLTIIKLDNSYYLRDRWRDRLTEAGFQVIRARDYQDGLRLARRIHPDLIFLVDDQPRGMDAIEWIELQHTDQDGVLALTPLLILAGRKAGAEVRLQELPDRVRLLLRPIDPALVIRAAQEMITHWR